MQRATFPDEMQIRSSTWVSALAAAIATLAAWLVFRALPPMHVRVGLGEIDALVPAPYQLSVFPAFGACVAAAAIELRRGDPAWRARAILVAVAGALAMVRLGGFVPISGHALFLSAALAFEAWRKSPTLVVIAAAIPALLVTGWYKVVVWGDPGWFVVSIAAGALLGAGVARGAPVG